MKMFFLSLFKIFFSISSILIIFHTLSIYSLPQSHFIFLIIFVFGTMLFFTRKIWSQRFFAFVIPILIFSVFIFSFLLFQQGGLLRTIDYRVELRLNESIISFSPNKYSNVLSGILLEHLEKNQLATISASVGDDDLISNYTVTGNGSGIPLGIKQQNYSEQPIIFTITSDEDSSLRFFPIYSTTKESIMNIFNLLSLKVTILLELYTEEFLILFFVITGITLLYMSDSKFANISILLVSSILLLSYLSIGVFSSFSNFAESSLFALIFYSIYQEMSHKRSAIHTKLTLFLIIAIFSAILFPNLGNDFSGSHSMKYAATLEPAVHMLENGPFSFTSQYRSNAFTEPPFFGKLLYFEQLPILTWANYFFLLIIPLKYITISSRIIMYLLGVLTLLTNYLAIKKVSGNPRFAIVSTLALSLNSIFLFTSFVTVLEMFLLLIFLSSILAIYSKKEAIPRKVGVLLGLGFISKVSFGFWGIVPIASLLLINNYKSFKNSLFQLIDALLGFITVNLLFRVLIRPLPSLNNVASLISALSFFTLIVLFYRNKMSLQNLVKKGFINIIFILILTIMLLGISFYVALNLFQSYQDSFISSLSLVFNAEFYQSIFDKYFWYYLSKWHKWTMYAGTLIFSSLIIIKKYQRLFVFLLTLSLSLFVYVIFAGKVLFFHNYYFLPLFVLFSYIISLPVLFSKKIFIPMMLFIIIISIAPLKSKGLDILSENRAGFQETVDFLNANTSENQFIIDDSAVSALAIFVDRPFTTLNSEKFSNSILKSGLNKALEDYSLSYLVTFARQPNYLQLNRILENAYISENRNDFIENTLNPSDKIVSNDFSSTQSAYLHLVKNFGQYKIYELRDDAE